MQVIKDFLKNNKYNFLITILWLVIAITTMFHHEIWKDEAQVWCLVRDLPIIDLFKAIRVEGHPFVWYLLNLPFAKLRFDVISMQIISLLFVFSAVLFIIFKTNLSNFSKFLLSFNAGMLYYLPIISRNYALIPILIVLLAKNYKTRHEHPYIYSLLIILMSLTHNLMLGFAGILGVIFVFEIIKNYTNEKNIKKIIPAGVVALDFLIIFITFLGAKEENYALLPDIKHSYNLIETLKIVAQAYFFEIFVPLKSMQKFFVPISFIAFYLPIILIINELRKVDKKVFAICTTGILFIFFTFYKIYFNGILYQKEFLIILILLFGYLFVEKEKLSNLFSNLIKFILVLSCITSFLVIQQEIKYNFSSGKEIANYIKQEVKDDTLITLGNPYTYSAISAYLPDKKLFSLDTNSYISYYSYKSTKNNNTVSYPEHARFYIVQNNIKDSDLDILGLKSIYKSNEMILSSKSEQEVFKICTLK